MASHEGPRTSIKCWLTEDAARRVMELAGQDLDSLRSKANSKEFRPISLGVTTSIHLDVAVRRQETANVLGYLRGADAAVADETVVFMAHHDHLGIADERDATGDNIYNGAIDNASGTASLLAMAEAIAKSSTKPRRSILFAFVGAEEQGLLGSKHFAMHPIIPAGYLAAVVNIDGFNFLGKTRDVNLIGNGKSSLDAIIEQIAAWQGRVVLPDYHPSRGYYYRSDQFSLAQVGVPGIYLHAGIHVVDKPEGWGKDQQDAWLDKDYHQPSDEYDPEWDLSGAVQDVRLLTIAGLEIANAEAMPTWNPGDEFEAARKQAIHQRQASDIPSSLR